MTTLSSQANWYETHYDVVTLGETMLRLSPPGLRRMEQATSLDIEVGGSESNTAVGLARLGMRVAWLSRLTANAPGRRIAQTIAGLGVDTGRVTWTDADRVGLYFLEEGRPPRASNITYDRANSAFSRMQPEDLPEQFFRPGNARLLHLTGITPAVSSTAAATARQALELAVEAGWRISFDLNYRGKLWSHAQARAGCEAFALAAHLLIVPLKDVRPIYNLPDALPPRLVLDELALLYPQATIILTMSKEGALAREPGGELLHQPAFLAEEVGRIGGGDAFSAGLLYGYLENETAPDRLAIALRWGAAVAALKYATPGDLPIITRQEVEALLSQAGNNGVSR